MDWFGLFLRLEGRIGRKAFWIGFAAVAAFLFFADLVSRGSGAGLLLSVVALYPLCAILAKRLHDRGRTGWWALIVLAPFAAAFLAGFVARMVGAGEMAILDAAKLGFVLASAVAAALIVYELGVREGDPGYSQHGPPPIA